MPKHQARVWSTYEVVGPPITSARTAFAVTETGWWAAKACSQPGMVLTGMNADEANTRGAITGKAAACAVSGSPVASPRVAKIQANEYPNSNTSNIPASSRAKLV